MLLRFHHTPTSLFKAKEKRRTKRFLLLSKIYHFEFIIGVYKNKIPGSVKVYEQLLYVAGSRNPAPSCFPNLCTSTNQPSHFLDTNSRGPLTEFLRKYFIQIVAIRNCRKPTRKLPPNQKTPSHPIYTARGYKTELLKRKRKKRTTLAAASLKSLGCIRS